MSKEKIVSHLQLSGVSVSAIINRPIEEGGGYFAYINLVRGEDGSTNPSKQKISILEKELADRGLPVGFILTDGYLLDIESGLRATLLANHSDMIRNVFLSLEGDKAKVWIEPKADARAEIPKLSGTARAFLELSKVKLQSIILTVDDFLPANFAILSALRTISPASLEKLSSALVAKNFSVPSDDWVRRKLESLRKKNLVVWIKSEANMPHTYTLTLKGLKALGTKKNRSSPDITRVLAICHSTS